MSKRELKSLRSTPSGPSPFQIVTSRLQALDQKIEGVDEQISELQRLKHEYELSRTSAIAVIENVIPTEPPLYNHNIRVGDVVRINEPTDSDHGFIGLVTKLTELQVCFETKFKKLRRTPRLLEIVGDRQVPRYHSNNVLDLQIPGGFYRDFDGDLEKYAEALELGLDSNQEEEGIHESPSGKSSQKHPASNKDKDLVVHGEKDEEPITVEVTEDQPDKTDNNVAAASSK